MNGLCYYEFKSRYNGLLIKMPWSYLVTAVTLLPVIYVAEGDTRVLLIELLVYWACILATLWLLLDLYVQKTLQEFAFNQDGIFIKRGNDSIIYYDWGSIVAIATFNEREAKIVNSLHKEGLVLSFDDGFKLKVFDRVTNYSSFKKLIDNQMLYA